MNKIHALLDKDFVIALLERRLPEFYPEIKKIDQLKIRQYKKMIWETTYHVVFGYRISWQNDFGQRRGMEVICSAHSNEPRENVISTLQYLWQAGMPTEKIKLPRPLFFEAEFSAAFYRAISGKNLLHFIKEMDFENVSRLVVAAAKMFARLHSLPVGDNFHFDLANQKVSLVVPGEEFIVREVQARFQPEEYGGLLSLYRNCASEEENNFSALGKFSLIHGDAHPENIIKVGSDKIGLIDFADFCPADFARDLGAFLQQLEYKIVRKAERPDFAKEMKNLFLSEYLQAAGITLDENLQQRINLYYDWTALRTAVYWFLNHQPSPEKGTHLVSWVQERRAAQRRAQD